MFPFTSLPVRRRDPSHFKRSPPFFGWTHCLHFHGRCEGNATVSHFLCTVPIGPCRDLATFTLPLPVNLSCNLAVPRVYLTHFHPANGSKNSFRTLISGRAEMSHTEVGCVDMLLIELYIRESVHRESNLIIVQKDATVFSLLHFCRQLYMFRVLTPIIRSSYNCNCSFWHWLATITSNSVFY